MCSVIKMDAEDVMLEEDLDLEDGSDDGEVDEEYITDPPSAQPSSGHASPPTSNTSSPPVLGEEPPSPRAPFSISQHLHFSGQPAGQIRRRPGRPRKEFSGITSRENKIMKRYRTGARGIPKRPRFSREERGELIANLESFSVPQSPGEDSNALDPETGALVPYDPKSERTMQAPEELPSFNEKWPGKLCSLCNLSERSQLGQGELLRYECPEGGFTIIKTEAAENDEKCELLSLVGSGGDKSPRTGAGPQLSNRRQKSLNKCKNPSITSEYTDELEKIGHSEIIEPSSLLESSGHFYIHSSCALWSIGVYKSDNEIVQSIGPVIVQSMSRKCFHCGHYGASLTCKMSCPKYFHYPCAAASGGFQDIQTYSTFCKEHLGQVPLVCSGDINCRMCNALGDVGNLMMCSACGDHYHGACAGVAQLPGVRAGWQCKICRWCQICRLPGDEGRSLSCEQCDKLYHPHCLRPQLASIPKYGWKCKCCRMCSDCGSRTPGAGLSSRWHAHYTVCDSCYQQRNKGFCCPLCHRAYRAAAYREMVQCHTCKKFVHGTCDSGADLASYQQRKDASPDYEYVCPICKSLAQAVIKRNSIEDDLTATDPLSIEEIDDSTLDKIDYGLGKGKPYLAGKIAKKRLGTTVGVAGRPKGGGKFPGKFGYQKRQKMTEFGRKRGPKAKMRGIFGVPGLGLQRPVADANYPKSEDEPGVENRLVLCSAKDKFVLTQDICVMCGSLGTDQEGCLISCAQCGQCYHPYCVNVKVTKVILTKGWRCLDCTVCEGCGQRNDESRLILCDDCDISYHIYCMDPPLDFVPHGNWKCKWCAICQVCGTNDPGFNCNWMNSFTECGPCYSHNSCASCHESYNEGELIIQCIQCERWLHCACDSIKSEADAERCASEGYTCNMCRPRDVPPPHLVPLPPPPKIVEIVKSPEVPKISMSNSQFFMDGVCLSASGMQQMRSLTLEQTASRKKRKPKLQLPLPVPVPQDKEANILATIESVVAGGSLDNSLENNRGDDKEDPSEIYRDGMVWIPKGNTGPPEGFTVYSTEAGVMILRRKRQRNLNKLGIGGFNVRMRGVRREKDEDDSSMPATPGATSSNNPLTDTSPSTSNISEFEKPKRKPVRRKPKSKLMECYPSYLQEAFFGRDLLETTKEKDMETSSSEEELASVSSDKTITLSHDELKVIEAMREKKIENAPKTEPLQSNNHTNIRVKNEKQQLIKQEVRDDGDISDTDALKDVLGLPNDLLDNDLVNRIMNEDDDLTKTSTIDELPDPALQDGSGLNETSDQKDELGDILGQHFNIESMVRDSLPNMDSKDVEEIFKGVLTDESQESQESSIFPISSGSSFAPHPAAPSTVQSVQQAPPVVTKALPSPMGFPSPYHSEYSSSPQFSPIFEPQSPWVGSSGDITPEERPATTPTSYNQRTTEKMRLDEALGMQATISAVLYANANHPEWKTEYPVWSDRYKQILKKWRSLPTEKKTAYLQKARDNRSAVRMKKSHQIPKEASTAVIPNPAISQKPAGRVTPIQQPPLMAAAIPGIIPSSTSEPEVQEKDGNTIAELTPASATNTVSLTPTNNSSIPLASDISSNPSIEPKVESADTSNVCEKQTPIIQNFNVKNLSIVRNAVSFSPNISVAHQSTPQFTVHHQYSLNHSGPAPNVTVNPNGNFNPTSSSIRNNHNFSTNIHFTPLIRTNFHANLSLIHHNINAVVQHNPTFTFNPVNIHTNQVANVIQLNPVTTTNTAVNIPYPSPAPSPFANTNISNNSGKMNISSADGLSQPTSSRSQSPCCSPKTPNTPHTPNRSITPTTPVARTPTPNLQINFISTGKTSHTTSYSGTTSNPQLTLSPIHGSSSPNLSDQQIRVLTPSEIMRTLPSLCQDNYDPPLPGAQTTDPEKNNHQRTIKEAEQERQWKQLQAQRLQQSQQTQQNIQEHRIHGSEICFPAMARVHRQLTDGNTFPHDQQNLTQQLQVSTNQEIGLGPLASPSPNSRNQFIGSQGKNRIAHPQSPSFTHPNLPPPSLVQRPNALNLPRQGPNLIRPIASQNISTPAEHIQRLTQSPFSPQPPQSPHEFPGSMSPAHGGQIDTFSRPPSESGSIENYSQSPQTPRSFGHQSPNPQRSPAYVGQTRISNEGYVQAPGTPRPQFNSPTPRPQVYLGMRHEYNSQAQPFASSRADQFSNQPGQNQPTEINRQLRDLLQRQQAPNQQRLWGQDGQQINPEPVVQTSESQSHGDATFRQPLPPGLVRPRVQGNVGAIIKPPVSVGQLGNMPRPQLQNIPDHGRSRMILQPGLVTQNLQRPVVQQYIQNPRMPQRSNATEQYDHLQQRNVQFPGKNQDAVLLSQRLGRQPDSMQVSPRLTQTPMPVQNQRNTPVANQQIPIQPPAMTPLQTAASTLSNQSTNISLPSPSPNTSSPSGGLTSEPPEIPDSVTAELDRLEQEGNGMAEVEGVGDILGGLGDDDDELLVSLTAEMGADFNILEYADPELDALTDGEKTNILDSLDLDEPDPEQEKPHVKKEPDEGDERIKSEQNVMPIEEKHKPDKKIKQEIIVTPSSESHKLSEKQMPPLAVTQTQLTHKNIPVSIGHVSKTLPITQSNLQLHANLNQNSQLNQPNQQNNQNQQLPQQSDNIGQLHQNIGNQQAILQQQIINQPMQVVPSLQQQQQIQQQMQHQVQQAAAMGRPMAPGTRLMSHDATAIGVVTANNTISVSFQGVLQPRHLHVHQPRIQMRMGPNGQQQRVVQVGPSSLQHQQMSVPRMGIAPPPPPPYPGPPPPYPGPLQQQMGVRLPPRPVPSPGPGALGAMLGHHNQLSQPLPIPRRPLLLQHSSQEQPLLLEELLEQEKREQERQQLPGDAAPTQVANVVTSSSQPAPTALLTDQEFERLRAEVVAGAGPLPLSSPPQGVPAQGLLPVQTNSAIRAPLPPRATTPAPWQPTTVRTTGQKPVPQTPAEHRIPLFALPVLPPPPLPPEVIQNEQDRQTQMHYEQWLSQQNQIVTQQLKYYDTEVQKLRKIRKSLNSKQRQLRKSGNELTETDAVELARISAEQSVLQKHLENARKQSRQHGMLIQEYRNKQQVRQAGNSPAPPSPLLSPSPGPLQQQPPASPMHSPGNLLAASQSPGPGSVGSILQSPGNHGNSNSSMSPHHMQPSPRIGTPHSQTDENPFSPSSGPTPSPSSLPTRMASPARMTSPQHRIVGQPAGLVGHRSAPSPTGYPQAQYQNQRFVRPTMVDAQRPRMNIPPVFLQGARPGFTSAQLPLGSPQPIMSSGVNTAVSQTISQQADALQNQRTMQMVQQRRLILQQQQQQTQQQQQQQQQTQQQLQQQTQQQQQQQQTQQQLQQQTQQQLQQQTQQQLQQQTQQQQLQQQTQQQQLQQQQLQQQVNMQQTQTTIAQQQMHHHQMLAQQQALAKQQMSHMQQQSGNQRSPMNQPPSSPLNPRSPMLQSLSQQMMNQSQSGLTHQQSISSQNQPQSPMSRGIGHGQYGQPPNSPMLPKSPLITQGGVHGGSPLSSMRRPPSTGGPISSPSSLPDRPHSRENTDPPRTPLTPFQHNPDLADTAEHTYNMGGGGGNPHNPQNPAPTPPGFGRFGYIKLGLRGGAPMWGSFGRGFKRIPTASGGKDSPTEKSTDPSAGKVKKESHINKVSILKKKPLPKPATITSTPAQAIPISKVTSLVCADYNEFDDSSSTPPISPAPSTSQQHDKKINKNINIGKKLPEEIIVESEPEVQMQEIVVIDSSPDEKQQILDYDDDNEKLVGAEVSLSSVAQPEDDITVIETFTTGELEEIVSSPLESEVAEEYVLFSSDMVVDYGVDSDDSMKHYVQKTTEEGEYSQQEITELGDKNVEIVNVSLESPNESSDEESSSKNEMHKGLRMDILKSMDHDILLAETPESPFQEDMNIDPSPEHYSPHTYKDEDLIASLGDGSEIVIIDPNVKSPEEHNIATTEDFEELIDCGNKQGSNGSPEDSGDEREEQNQPEAPVSVAEAAQIVQTVTSQKTVVTTMSKPIVMTRLPIINATVISPRPTKKLVKEVTQTTAMVSIGNTTISVPVLKNVPLTTSSPDKKLNECSVAQSVSLSKSTIISVVSTGSRLSMANTISLGKLNLTSTTLTAPPRMSTPINSSQILKPKIIEKINEKPPSSPSIVYPTLSTLNISPDASLPQKIFEDESISPDSSIGNDLEDIEKEEQQEPPSAIETQQPVEDIVEKKNDTADNKNQTVQFEIPKTEENVDDVQMKMSPEEMLEQILKESEGDKKTRQADDKPSSTVFTSQDKVLGNTITIHNEMGESMEEPLKSVEHFEDMLTMLETFSGDSKLSPAKDINSSKTNVKSADDLVTALSDHSQDSMADINDIIQQDLNKQLQEAQEVNREKVDLPPKPSVIPVHVIIKSRESSQSPVTVANVSRLTSVMPQLSPLSQPSELTSNVANATQQLRTIMSSVSSNNMVKLDMPPKEIQQSTPIARPDSLGLTQVNFENLLPSTKVEVLHKIEQTPRTNLVKSITEKQLLSQVMSNKPSPSSSRSESPVTMGGTVSVIPTRITTQTGRLSPVITSAGNIIIGGKKQRRSSPAGSPASISGSPKHSPLIGTQSPMNSPKVTPTGINTSTPMVMPNLTKIQGPIKSETRPASILGSTLTQPQQIRQTFSVNQPPALIMTARTAPPLSVTTTSFLPLSQTNLQAVISTAGVVTQPETVTLFQTISQSIANSSNVVTVMKPTSTLLHSQLTGPPFRRSKSTDEVPVKSDTVGHIQAIKRHSVEMITTVKAEPMDTLEDSLSSQINAAKLDIGNIKFTTLSMTPKTEDSQNVLLKQLLQNTGSSSASSLTNTILPRSTVQSLSTHQRAPSLGLVSSLEAQLARPVIPPPTPPTSITHVEVPKSSPVRILSRETSFVSRPLPTQTQTVPASQLTQTQALIDIRRNTTTPVVRTTVKEEIVSPTPKPTPLANPTPPPVAVIQREIAPPQQSPVQPMLQSHEVKKELIDDSSQQSAISGISDQGKLEMPIKEEFPEGGVIGESSENKLPDKASEFRKRKRREYQQNRRKNQNQNKLEAVVTAGPLKKKPRKGSKMEEDYDVYIDSLMVQLRGLQQLPIIEPPLCRNFGVCPIFGSGDLAKIGVIKDYSTRKGDLEANYGSAVISNVADSYNTKPFGDKDPLPEQPAASTQRGFYDQEFSPIKFEHDIEDRKLEVLSRDIDTPDTIMSSSSPECIMWDVPYMYPGLRLIEENSESDEDSMFSKRASPIIPLIAPIPIRLKPGTPFILDKETDKENIGLRDSSAMGVKSRFGPPIPLKESSNVTVTLTLTSTAAEDIFGVLKDLANILHIPPPTGYQIVERTTTPPSQKLGLYRTKGKDGKEGAPIDIQTILNGAAKFCRHCDVVILNSLIRAKVSEFPLLPRNNELINDTDDLYFCSKSCYKQFQWRPTSILDEKSIRKTSPDEAKVLITDSATHEKDESMDIDEQCDILIKQEIKDEDMDTFVMDENKDINNKLNELSVQIPKEDISSKLSKKGRKADEALHTPTSQPPSKIWKGQSYKLWNYGCIQPAQKYKKPSEKDITAMIFKVGITVMPPKIPDDIRKCIFCHQIGDSTADGPARLLNFDVDKWVHLNCALWSDGVYETVNGALMNLENALQVSLSSNCVHCSKTGATIRCFKTRCTNIYHLSCACKDGCVFYKNKTAYCSNHVPKGEKDNELTTLSVQRRVYINRDENRQVASVMHHSDLSNLLRVGSLIFLNVGQLLPHQLQAFHTPNYIYPIGYKIVRFYWSMRQPNKRCRYICSIADVSGRPEFRVLVQETTQDDIELRDISPRAVWTRILDPLAAMRKDHQCVKLFPKFVTGEDLFGLTEPAVVRVLESLPGIETLTDYRFKYGRNPLLELPLAINPTGAARSEPKLKSSMTWKKPHTQRTASSSNSRSAPVPGSSMAGEAACPYSKQFVHSKSSQYKKMKQDWRNNVFLARSKIQGLGLYAARDIEKHTMVIEYIGEVIRHELSELREKQYEARNRGIYMFRLDEERVVDATLSGGLARYINHSCNPNCVAEIIEVDREVRIIIFAKRRINRGEELSYDYKFDIEDDAHKISCMCGAPNCKKWMN